MTPRERASDAVLSFHGAQAWGYDPSQHAEFERHLARAIEAAEANATALERLRCVAAVESLPGPETGVTPAVQRLVIDAILGGAR